MKILNDRTGKVDGTVSLSYDDVDNILDALQCITSFVPCEEKWFLLESKFKALLDLMPIEEIQ